MFDRSNSSEVGDQGHSSYMTHPNQTTSKPTHPPTRS